MHLELKFFALLVAPPLLEAFVLSSNGDRTMGLSARRAGTLESAVMALTAKLEAVADFTAFLLGQFAAIGARLTNRDRRLFF